MSSRSGTCTVKRQTDRVAYASRVLASASRDRGLSVKDCFGKTPKPTRETRVQPRLPPFDDSTQFLLQFLQTPWLINLKCSSKRTSSAARQKFSPSPN